MREGRTEETTNNIAPISPDGDPTQCRTITIGLDVEEVHIDLSEPRYILVVGTTRKGRVVKRMLSVTKKGGISLV